ncbi:hypothetical protein KIN20_022796 [Parelaphostrongylus tenuis]|uniref:Uncharacterized protein n=1 Tax=Parelaphostrongylus tenuis TaxID=148309 RepID=A0AAD5QX05_PARTN|nr:hypothetical protein KIN20_022796 [Parelaphostrongylus tenuis]
MSSNNKPVHRPPHIAIPCSVRYALNRIRRGTEWVRSLAKNAALTIGRNLTRQIVLEVQLAASS